MMREPDYIMPMMATGGRLLTDETCKHTKRSWLENGVQRVKEFVYALPFDWHFRYCHAVDDHNNLRHAVRLKRHGLLRIGSAVSLLSSWLCWRSTPI
jgi:hypothetical protein